MWISKGEYQRNMNLSAWMDCINKAIKLTNDRMDTLKSEVGKATEEIGEHIAADYNERTEDLQAHFTELHKLLAVKGKENGLKKLKSGR